MRMCVFRRYRVLFSTLLSGAENLEVEIGATVHRAQCNTGCTLRRRTLSRRTPSSGAAASLACAGPRSRAWRRSAPCCASGNTRASLTAGCRSTPKAGGYVTRAPTPCLRQLNGLWRAGTERFRICEVKVERPVLICEVEILSEEEEDATAVSVRLVYVSLICG